MTLTNIHHTGTCICSKGSCSMFGANDSAVAGGGLLQLRALDWNVDGKLSCSSLTTYIYFFFLRPFQKLSTNHSLPSNRSQKWSSICKHRIYWMDWLYNRSAYKTAIDQLTIPFMYLTTLTLSCPFPLRVLYQDSAAS